MVDRRECPLCVDARGARWSEYLQRGTKTTKEAATAFGISVADVEEHLFKHEPSWEAKSVKDESYDKEFYIKRLDQIGTDLNRMLDDVLDGDTSTENIRNATSLTKEIRETLRLLGEITRVLKDDEAAKMERTVLTMRENYLALTNIIMKETCPSCQAKIIEAINKQKALVGGVMNER